MLVVSNCFQIRHLNLMLYVSKYLCFSYTISPHEWDNNSESTFRLCASISRAFLQIFLHSKWRYSSLHLFSFPVIMATTASRTDSYISRPHRHKSGSNVGRERCFYLVSWLLYQWYVPQLQLVRVSSVALLRPL